MLSLSVKGNSKNIQKDPYFHPTPTPFPIPESLDTIPIPESFEVWEWYGSRLHGKEVLRAWGSLQNL